MRWPGHLQRQPCGCCTPWASIYHDRVGGRLLPCIGRVRYAEIMQLPSLAQIRDAQAVVYRHMPPTPQYTWPLINEHLGTEAWIKHENHTPVGAFKLRGALVYMDWLKQTQPELAGVVAATRGNH